MALVALGIVLRLRVYLANRSLWLDEAMLALNLAGRDLAALLSKPLAHHQGAPPGFLTVEKLAITALGNHELAFRLLPMLAGTLGLLVFYLAARRVLAGLPLVLATALLACGPLPLYYSAEVKQYSVDLLATSVILWLTLRIVAPLPAALTWRSAGGLTAIGIIAPWMAHASVFVLPAAWLTLLGAAWRRGDRKARGPLIAMPMLWLASFGVLYLVNLRQLTGDAYLYGYWQDAGALLPFPPTSRADVLAYPRSVLRLSRDLFAPENTGYDVANWAAVLGLVLGGLGIAYFARPRSTTPAAAGPRALLPLLVTPFVLAGIASVFVAYPLYDRLMLFAHPLAVLLIGAGLAAFLQRKDPSKPDPRPRERQLVAAGLTLLALALPARVVLPQLRYPHGRDEVRDVLREIVQIENARRAGELCVYYTLAGAEATVDYYTHYDPQCRPKNLAVLHGPTRVWEQQYASINEANHFRAHCGAKRVWLVLGTLGHYLYAQQDARVKERFDAVGTRVAEIHRPGAAGYLYELK